MNNSTASTHDIITDLSSSIRPQDDFFRYVNDSWLNSTEIPADQTSAGAFIDLRNEAERQVREIIENLGAEVNRAQAPQLDTFSAQASADLSEAEKIGILYSSFMEEERIDALQARPAAADLELINACTDKAQLARTVGILYRTGVCAPFFVEIDANHNSPDDYIAWIGQSGLGLPDEAYYRAPEHADTLAAYREFIPKLYSLVTGVDAETAQGAASTILELETQFAAHHFTVVEERDVEKTNNVMSRENFFASARGFEWEAAFAEIGLTEHNSQELLIYTPRALTGFAEVWKAASLDDLKTYLSWRVVTARAPFLSSEIVATHFDFYGKTLSGQEQLRDRWKRAVGFVSSIMGEAVGRIYVHKHFPPEYKAQMEQLVADLLEAYRQSITNLDWMTDETKQKALEKLAAFTPKIAYPDVWKDYSALCVTAGNLVENVRLANSFEHQRDIAKLGTPVDRSEWFMTPQTVNAYYNPTMNEIVFPAAILQPPFFRAHADAAWNYGSIGAVIGHEIGHGFDDQGSKYDGTGKLNNWWTQGDLEEFKQRTSALVEQYNAYVPKQLGTDSVHHVQGDLTLGENIGDLGGVTIALKAYAIAMQREGFASAEEAPVIDGLTGIQRFFISYALSWQEKRRTEFMIQLLATDPHSPAEFRCNGIVKNVDAFAQAFEVREGDELYLAPEKRVRIW